MRRDSPADFLKKKLTQARLHAWLSRQVGPADDPMGMVAVGTILITYGIGNRFCGRLVGIGSAVVLASCYQFIAAGRFGTSDMLLTFFLYGGLYAYVQTREHTRWWFGVGAFIGLALMTKGPAAFVGPAAIGKTTPIELIRGGEVREITVVPAPRPE